MTHGQDQFEVWGISAGGKQLIGLIRCKPPRYFKDSPLSKPSKDRRHRTFYMIAFPAEVKQ